VRHRRLREPFVYFVDECLGRHVVPDGLRKAVAEGERVVTRPKGTLDLDWIPEADTQGWVCITKDRALKKRPNELAALLGSAFATFMLGEATGEIHAARVVAALPVIRRILRVRDVPLVARIEEDAGVSVLYEGGKRLEPPRRMKRRAGEPPPEHS
jgi:hypothetical protein